MDSRLAHAVAVGRLGSFSKAADAVSLSQPAVTRSVADLERQLGYPLFHRTSRGVLPTQEGSVFLERAQRILSDAAELLSSTSMADPCAGTLRIGVFPGTIEWVLMRPLEALIRRHPSIRFDLVTGTIDQGLRMLERGDVDVAICVEHMVSGRPQFKYQRFGTIQPLAFVRHGHPALAERREPGSLASYPLVLPTTVWDADTVLRFSELFGADLTAQCHKVANFPLACKLVEASDAIGLSDAAFTETNYFRERFEALPDFPVKKRYIGSATRGQWTPKPNAVALISTLAQVHGGSDMAFDMDARIAPHSRQ